MLASLCGSDLAAATDIPDAAIRVAEGPGVMYRPITSPVIIGIGDGRHPYQSVPCLSREALPKEPRAAMTPRNRSADVILVLDAGMIIDRGRGPEIKGTRTTIYDIMDYIKYDYDSVSIAEELGLTEDQVRAAVEYIRSHQAESDHEYGLIMEQTNRPNPPEAERGRAETWEELRRRIRARLDGRGGHAPSVGS